jgi:hypothetical protein
VALPAGVLEVRIATHNYNGQDDDELTFVKGDTIHVVPFADPEDAEVSPLEPLA